MQYLLEIGLEEIPARYLKSLSLQLQDRVESFLKESKISFESTVPYATPRRLAILVNNIAEKQDDFQVVAKGPTMKIAKDHEGNWSKAALGFFNSQKANPNDAYVETVKDVEYLYISKKVQGKETKEVLKEMGNLVAQMTFPVAMTWNQLETPYIRPIHWFVSLLDKEIIPFEFVGIKADRISRGHRFLGQAIAVESPKSYETQLEEQFVLVDFERRQAEIRLQIEALAKEKNWKVPIDADLLEEVTSLVEWPTVFYGEFDAAYLEVPEIVLMTAMKDHQRYFYALDQSDRLLPVFISVRNGNDQSLENVVKGNKKVLKARLEDALFFYKEDLKHSLDYYVEKLSHVNEHFKLGSLAQKQLRVEALVGSLGQRLGLDAKEIDIAKEAARIYKYDLMTQTVGEFDELQGEMGAIYAKHYGINEDVALAIRQQYLPKSSGGALPTSQASRLLGLADKLDTLINYFKVGLIPTGSNDPYALRRNATGIIEIMNEADWQIDLSQVFKDLTDEQSQALIDTLEQFIKARISVQLEKESIDYDIIHAVLAANFLNPVLISKIAKKLATDKVTSAEKYRGLVEAISRVVNIGSKVDQTREVNMELAQTESEKALIEALTNINQEQIYDSLKTLVSIINQYFEENLVNANETEIRENRLAIMKKISDLSMQLFDSRLLISKF